MKKRKLTKRLAAAIFAAVIVACMGCTGVMGQDQSPKSQPAQRYSQPAIPYTEDGEGNAATSSDVEKNSADPQTNPLSISDISTYSGSPYVEINDNIPQFSSTELNAPYATEEYGELDELGRCTYAFAIVGPETQPTSKRGNISDIKPTGWKQNLNLYSLGLDHLYERSHLLAHMLTGEDANRSNLITGTHYLNQNAMLNFEIMVDDYVDSTRGHVAMKVTPVFLDDELVARGVHMEAYSLEDDGASISYNVFCYNVQPGVVIDYSTGESYLE